MKHFRSNRAIQDQVLWTSAFRLERDIPSFRMVVEKSRNYLGLRYYPCHEFNDFVEYCRNVRPKIVAIHKPRINGLVDVVRQLQSGGMRIVTTHADWSFDGEEGEVIRQIAPMVDYCVVQTYAMADIFEQYTGVTPAIIEEIVEYPRAEPEFAPSNRLRLLWYGNTTNLDSLLGFIEGLQESGRTDHHLTVVGSTAVLDGVRDLGVPTELVNLKLWSQSMQMAQMKLCDLIVIPSSNDEKKRAKGQNRLTEALNVGRFPVASPLPQYQELAEVSWLGNDLLNGIDWARRNPDKVLERMIAGQKVVDERFSVAAVSKKWQQLFEALL